MLCLCEHKGNVWVGTESVIVVWSAETQRRSKILKQHTKFVHRIISVGEHVWSCSSDCSIVVWNTEGEPIKKMEQQTKVLSLLPMERHIWAGCRDGSVSLFDKKNYELVQRVSQVHTNAVTSLAYSIMSSGLAVWSASWDRSIVVFETTYDAEKVKKSKKEALFLQTEHKWMKVKFNGATTCDHCRKEIKQEGVFRGRSGYVCEICQWCLHKKCLKKVDSSCPAAKGEESNSDNISDRKRNGKKGRSNSFSNGNNDISVVGGKEGLNRSGSRKRSQLLSHGEDDNNLAISAPRLVSSSNSFTSQGETSNNTNNNNNNNEARKKVSAGSVLSTSASPSSASPSSSFPSSSFPSSSSSSAGVIMGGPVPPIQLPLSVRLAASRGVMSSRGASSRDEEIGNFSSKCQLSSSLSGDPEDSYQQQQQQRTNRPPSPRNIVPSSPRASFGRRGGRGSVRLSMQEGTNLKSVANQKGISSSPPPAPLGEEDDSPRHVLPKNPPPPVPSLPPSLPASSPPPCSSSQHLIDQKKHEDDYTNNNTNNNGKGEKMGKKQSSPPRVPPPRTSPRAFQPFGSSSSVVRSRRESKGEENWRSSEDALVLSVSMKSMRGERENMLVHQDGAVSNMEDVSSPSLSPSGKKKRGKQRLPFLKESATLLSSSSYHGTEAKKEKGGKKKGRTSVAPNCQICGGTPVIAKVSRRGQEYWVCKSCAAAAEKDHDHFAKRLSQVQLRESKTY